MKAILLHGTGNDWRANWIPWVKTQLEKRGYEVYVPSLPDSDFPNAAKWSKYVIDNVPFTIDDDTIIVGHSAGAALIPQLLQQLPDNTKIKKAILVSGSHTDLGWEKLKDILNVAVDYKKVAKMADEFVIIYSDNDPYVPVKEAEWLAKNLNGTLKLIPGQGHFNLEASPKYKEFPKLIATILREQDAFSELIDKLIDGKVGDIFVINGVKRKILALAKYRTENLGDDEYLKAQFDDGSFLLVILQDKILYFTDKIVHHITEIKDEKIGVAAELEYDNKKFKLVNKNDYQYCVHWYFGNFSDLETECAFSDYEQVDDSSIMLSLGWIAKNHARADIYVNELPLENIKYVNIEDKNE